MSDESAMTSPVPALAEISSAMAPIIYFESAPNFGTGGGICSIALEAMTYVSVDNAIRIERRVVAHLRMTPAGFASLRQAVNGIELSITPAPEQSVN
jgi:hypothetical protein